MVTGILYVEGEAALFRKRTQGRVQYFQENEIDTALSFCAV